MSSGGLLVHNAALCCVVGWDLTQHGIASWDADLWGEIVFGAMQRLYLWIHFIAFAGVRVGLLQIVFQTHVESVMGRILAS